MARKKIMLFIVEGPTDETALSTVLSRIFSSDTVRFQVVHGDVLTQDFVGPDKMVAAVNEQIKRFRGNIYRPGDFCKVVHLTDTDGAFIPESAVVKETLEEKQYPFSLPLPFYVLDLTRNGCSACAGGRSRRTPTPFIPILRF